MEINSSPSDVLRVLRGEDIDEMKLHLT